MSCAGSPRVTGRIVAGAILILLGVLFTLDNFGLVQAGDVFRYWPLFIVGFGLLKVSHSRAPEQRVGGVVVTAVGILLLARSLRILPFGMRQIWPVVLLVFGALLVWQSIRGRRPRGEYGQEIASEGVLAGARERLGSMRGETIAGSTLNEFAFMGGGDRVVRSQDFRGGEVTAIMGGFQIDLRGAAIGAEAAEMEVFTLWGGVDLRVPEDWNVVVRGVPVLGVFSNSTRSAGSALSSGGVPGKTLVVKGMSIMGGVEVKN
ncbi:MAG: DUF5668 domain-containing protein [Acidobacteriota bacterium]